MYVVGFTLFKYLYKIKILYIFWLIESKQTVTVGSVIIYDTMYLSKRKRNI